MLRFFRRIRQGFVHRDKLSRYLLYALGELLLVVAGILIALRLNNLNEYRNKIEEFNTSLEMVYNSIEKDMNTEEFNNFYLQQQLDHINIILEKGPVADDPRLPYILYYLNMEPGLFNMSESPFHLAQFRQFPGGSRENELSKQISNYVNNLTNIAREKGRRELLGEYLSEAGIPEPMLVFGYSAMDNFSDLEAGFYTDRETEAARRLLGDTIFRAQLKSLASRKKRLLFFGRGQIDDARSLQAIIREYNPEIRLLYEEVGILGTALHGYDDVPGVKSTPMKLIDPRQGLWETTLELKNGTVKFRTRNSWNENWGGNSFPEGKLLFYGENIPVKAGRYRISLNLKDNTYRFDAIQQ